MYPDATRVLLTVIFLETVSTTITIIIQCRRSSGLTYLMTGSDVQVLRPSLPLIPLMSLGSEGGLV